MRKFIVILTLMFTTLIGCKQSKVETVQPISSVIPTSQTTLVERDINPVNPNWAYINKKIKWEAPPKQIENRKKGSLNSTIVVFYPSGKFASVGCTLYQDNKTKAITLSAGDDFSVSKGTWKQNEDESITTVSQLTHGALRNAPEEIGKWIIRSKATDKIADEFELNGQIYIPIQHIGGFDQLSAMIADDNR